MEIGSECVATKTIVVAATKGGLFISTKDIVGGGTTVTVLYSCTFYDQ